MRILVSNDDGIHAEGLDVLEEIARDLSDDVWTVAPETDQSGVSRSLTLSDPLRLRKVSHQRYAVSGTPTDCVQIAVTHLLAEKKPDLVLSGINNGQNLAEDLTFSGTIAAALQGMTLGLPSVALSLSRFSRDKVHWQTPRELAPDILRKLIAKGWPDHIALNINFPDKPPQECGPVQITRQGMRDQLSLYAEEREDLRGRRYYWFGFS
ncbi:MAG: 5'/3'-nucleotidase SurE, partial [Parvularculaceae bacterium]